MTDPVPTLGDIYKVLKPLMDRGVAAESVLWVLKNQFPVEVTDVLAERDTLAAQVQAVERELARMSAWGRGADAYDAIGRIRRALGTPTTGGGECESARRARFNPSDPEGLGFGPGDYA